MLHGDWRVVVPLRGATYHLKGDPGKLEANSEHLCRQSIQKRDSVEAPDSSPYRTQSCLEPALPAFAAAGTRSHCQAQAKKLRRHFPDCFLALSSSILGGLEAVTAPPRHLKNDFNPNICTRLMLTLVLVSFPLRLITNLQETKYEEQQKPLSFYSIPRLAAMQTLASFCILILV